MNKKIGFIIVSTLFLVTALTYVPLTFAQTTYWDYAKVSAYGKDLDDFSSSCAKGKHSSTNISKLVALSCNSLLFCDNL